MTFSTSPYSCPSLASPPLASDLACALANAATTGDGAGSSPPSRLLAAAVSITHVFRVSRSPARALPLKLCGFSKFPDMNIALSVISSADRCGSPKSLQSALHLRTRVTLMYSVRKTARKNWESKRGVEGEKGGMALAYFLLTMLGRGRATKQEPLRVWCRSNYTLQHLD